MNSHILEAIYSAMEEKVLPSIQNAVRVQITHSNSKVDLRLDGQQPNSNVEISRKPRVDFHTFNSFKNNQNSHTREFS